MKKVMGARRGERRRAAEGDGERQDGATVTAIGNTEYLTSARGYVEELAHEARTVKEVKPQVEPYVKGRSVDDPSETNSSLQQEP